MPTDRPRLALAAAALAAALAWPMGSFAAPATAEVPLLDPWVPPAVREKALAAPPAVETRGEALRAQVERKLRARFEAAAGPEGALTREQARAAGLGFIAGHFAAIDRQGDGRVTFPEYLDYLRSRQPR